MTRSRGRRRDRVAPGHRRDDRRAADRVPRARDPGLLAARREAARAMQTAARSATCSDDTLDLHKYVLTGKLERMTCAPVRAARRRAGRGGGARRLCRGDRGEARRPCRHPRHSQAADSDTGCEFVGRRRRRAELRWVRETLRAPAAARAAAAEVLMNLVSKDSAHPGRWLFRRVTVASAKAVRHRG